MERKRFKRDAVASSRGNYVRVSHREFIKEQHLLNRDAIEKLTITIKVKPKYYTKCFGVMIEITEAEANKLGKELVITI